MGFVAEAKRVLSTSQLEIDLSAVERNVRVIRRVLAAGHPPRGTSGQNDAAPAICAVLKADAYGLGAARIAKRLTSCGVEMIAVYTPEQARGLIEAAIAAPILILMPMRELDRRDELYHAASRSRLHLAVHDRENLSSLIEIADNLGLTLPVHLEVDTGLSRGGAEPREAMSLLARIDEHPRLRLAGLYTHFASGDSDGAFTLEQAERFARLIRDAGDLVPADCLVHQASTYSLFRDVRLHRRMVRVGLALYGYASEEFENPDEFGMLEEAESLEPSVRWISRVVHLKTIDPGTPVGYGSTWRAKRRTRIALIPVGYADGYPRALSNKGRVAIEIEAEAGGNRVKAFAPIIGRVSMDQITVDVTDLPDGSVKLGSVVEVIGKDRTAPNHLATLAREAGTICHELLCRLSPRLPRTYLTMTALMDEHHTPKTCGVA